MELTEGKRGAGVEIPTEITELKLSFVKHKKYVKHSENEDFSCVFTWTQGNITCKNYFKVQN